MGWQMFLSSFMIFALAKFTNNDIPISQVSLKTWSAIAYLIIMGSVLAFAAFIYSIKYLPTGHCFIVCIHQPHRGLCYSVQLILDEPLTINLLLGAVVTLVGVYIVNYSVKKT
jgi:drug/metabolite transporter (DMT)-like permease